MLALGRQIGAFRVLRPLGRGGASTVYAVRHVTLGTEHALKVIHRPSLAARVRLEGEVQQRIVSRYVVPVQAVLSVDGQPALLMPQVRGCSLKELLEIRQLTEEEALALFVGIVEGVAAAHAAGVVHRDVKPSNVLLDPHTGSLVPRLTDFGVAQFVSSDATRTGDFLGTHAYAAPEQRRDAGSVDARADLWSLGVLLHEMLLGRKPHADRMDSKVPERFRTILLRLLKRDPDQRFASALALRAQLGQPALEPLGFQTALGELVRRRFEVALDTTEAESTQPHPASALLPAERDVFIGRDSDFDLLWTALHRGRVVTVTGLGGIGKTRFIVNFIRNRDVGGRTPVWCDLAESTNRSDVLAAMAQGLGANAQRSLDAKRLAFVIQQRGPCLIALDNAEQVADILVELLDVWTAAAPDARFLVTSRVPLGLVGEQQLPLEPLSEPEAKALFEARALAVQPAFNAASQTSTLHAVLRLLDGIPLAIEFAAARVRLLPLKAILARLTDRFRLLKAMSPRPSRQATLRATLDWSVQLLTAEERAALLQLSVFEPSFDLEAVESVLDSSSLTLDVMDRLVSHSLVQVERDGRFRLLLTVQEYAAQALDSSGLRSNTEQRHGAYYAALSESIRPSATASHVDALAILTREIPNITVACDRALRRQDPVVALSTLRAATLVRSRIGTAERNLELAQRLVAIPKLSDEDQALALDELARNHRQLGQTAESRRAFEAAIEHWSATSNAIGKATSYLRLSTLLNDLGLFDDARKAAMYAREVAKETPDDPVHASARLTLGQIATYTGDFEAAQDFLHACLDPRRNHAGAFRQANVHNTLGVLYLKTERPDRARQHLEQALALHERFDPSPLLVRIHTGLANLAIYQGRLEDAEHHYREGMKQTRNQGFPQGYAILLGGLGILHEERGQWADAFDLHRQALALHRTNGGRMHAAIALINLGRIQGMVGAFGEAEGSFKTASAALEAGGAIHYVAECQVHLGVMLVHAKRFEAAKAVLLDALPALRESRNALFEAVALAQLGNVAANQGRSREASRYWDQAIEQLMKAETPAELAKIWADRARHQARWSRNDAANALSEAERLAEGLVVPEHGELGVLLALARQALAVPEPG
ncbi:MAG: tetratricopeptide repeat protein [Myxococcota bacterium]